MGDSRAPAPDCLSLSPTSRNGSGSAFFFDQPKPSAVRLHLVRDELLAAA